MFHKLAHMSPALHSTAHHIVEPMDLKVSHRHLHITYSSMKHSDKTFMGMTTSGKNAKDVMDMCEILFGRDVMEETPVVTGNGAVRQMRTRLGSPYPSLTSGSKKAAPLD